MEKSWKIGAAVALLSTAVAATGLSIPAQAAGATLQQAAEQVRQECRNVQTDWSVEASPHAAPESLLNAYSNTGKGWTGGDSTYSVELPGGRTAWVFSDTFLGPVNPDGSRATTTPFINNSFIVQRGNSLETVTGGTATEPTALVPPPVNGWYWLGAADTSRGGRNVDVVALRFERTGTGPWDWRWASNYLARFDTKTLKLQKLFPLPSTANVQWSAWRLRQGGYTYVYGVEDLGASKYQHVARVKGDDLIAAPWQYWTGTGWSSDEKASARVLEGVANEHSVTRWGDGYLLVTHDTTELFSQKVLGYFSCSPTGPFVKPVELYRTPETGAAGSYGDADIITYNSHDHPDQRLGSTLLLSYNVNSLDPNTDLYADVSIYRPRFVGVTLTPGGQR